MCCTGVSGDDVITMPSDSSMQLWVQGGKFISLLLHYRLLGNLFDSYCMHFEFFTSKIFKETAPQHESKNNKKGFSYKVS